MTTAMYDAREAIIPGSVYDRSSQGESSSVLTFPRLRLVLSPHGWPPRLSSWPPSGACPVGLCGFPSQALGPLLGIQGCCGLC